MGMKLLGSPTLSNEGKAGEGSIKSNVERES